MTKSTDLSDVRVLLVNGMAAGVVAGLAPVRVGVTMPAGKSAPCRNRSGCSWWWRRGLSTASFSVSPNHKNINRVYYYLKHVKFMKITAFLCKFWCW